MSIFFFFFFVHKYLVRKHVLFVVVGFLPVKGRGEGDAYPASGKRRYSLVHYQADAILVCSGNNVFCSISVRFASLANGGLQGRDEG